MLVKMSLSISVTLYLLILAEDPVHILLQKTKLYSSDYEWKDLLTIYLV